MAERSIGAEVLQGLREVKQCRASTRTLRTTRVEAKPLPGLTPELIKRIRQEIDVSRAAFAGLLRVPVRTVESSVYHRGSSVVVPELRGRRAAELNGLATPATVYRVLLDARAAGRGDVLSAVQGALRSVAIKGIDPLSVARQ